MPIRAQNYITIGTILRKAHADSLAWDLDDFHQKSLEKRIIYFLNAHGVNTCLRSHEFSDTLLNGEYLLRDGIGLKIALNWLGLSETPNLNGTDLIPKILEPYKDKKIALYGASDDVLDTVKEKLRALGYHNIVSTLHGFHDAETYIQDSRVHAPDIIILCMGMPKQELLSRHLLDHTNLVICGGGWADFYSGEKQRAPLWMRKASIEWVHRLIKEPKRLGKRYTIDIFCFFLTIMKVVYFSRKAPDQS